MNDKSRWNNYRLANEIFLNSRSNEFNKLLNILDPKKGECILELGTGNGYLTTKISKIISNKGKIITYDAVKDNFNYFKKINKKLNLSIVNKLQNLNYKLDEKNEIIDKVFSIASIHHYDNKYKSIILNKLKAFEEFYRVLKEGGKLIISDVCDNTCSQRYFDALDDPKYCYPDGHPHYFLDKNLIKYLCEKTGFKLKYFKILNVPWEFENISGCKKFLHTIHNSKVSKEEIFELAKKYLKIKVSKNKVVLEWKLFYMVAEKPKIYLL